MNSVLISGTPGTGKTTLATKLSECRGYGLIDMGRLAETEHIYVRIDAGRDTKIIDERKLSIRVEREIRSTKGKVIIPSHYAEIVKPKLVDKIIVLRTRPSELRKRLMHRGWSEGKIQENLEAEILGVCSYNALTKYGRSKVYEIDTTSLSPDETLKIALDILESKEESHIAGSIDWLAELEESELDLYMMKK
ncbi:MAG: adenylate kinase family protein [Candidatus Atabeyarchaeum deiterrae]